jgi:hypothetical protein
VGSTKDEVIAIQGTPTSYYEESFSYGNSHVYLENDRVVRWHSWTPKLKAQLLPNASSTKN